MLCINHDSPTSGGKLSRFIVCRQKCTIIKYQILYYTLQATLLSRIGLQILNLIPRHEIPPYVKKNSFYFSVSLLPLALLALQSRSSCVHLIWLMAYMLRLRLRFTVSYSCAWAGTWRPASLAQVLSLA